MLGKDIEEYGVLKFTKKAEASLKKPKSSKVILNHLYDDANADDEEGTEATTGAAADDRLSEMLKELREKVGKKVVRVTRLIVLENTLQDMTTLYQTTLEELQ